MHPCDVDWSVYCGGDGDELLCGPLSVVNRSPATISEGVFNPSLVLMPKKGNLKVIGAGLVVTEIIGYSVVIIMVDVYVLAAGEEVDVEVLAAVKRFDWGLYDDRFSLRSLDPVHNQ